MIFLTLKDLSILWENSGFVQVIKTAKFVVLKRNWSYFPFTFSWMCLNFCITFWLQHNFNGLNWKFDQIGLLLYDSRKKMHALTFSQCGLLKLEFYFFRCGFEVWNWLRGFYCSEGNEFKGICFSILTEGIWMTFCFGKFIIFLFDWKWWLCFSRV